MKSLVMSLFILLCVGLVVNAYDKDTVAVWLMEEGSGNTIKDATGNNHDGKLTGGKWVNGKFGKAIQFNGTSDFIEVAHDATLDLQTYTIVATFMVPATPTGWYTIICKDTAGPTRNYGLYVGTTGLLNCSFSSAKAWQGIHDPAVEKELNTRVDDNKWHVVAISYDMKMYRVFIDGTLEAEKSLTAKPDTGVMPVMIGSWVGGGWLNGMIDEIYLSKRGLTQADIVKFNNGISLASAVSSKEKAAITWGQVKSH